ncbi:hypothetical protein FRC03_005461 [Tulasnella sp. 419]|nr:hypothetical protein FRC03_005461 [Tulasnella sp. 419]
MPQRLTSDNIIRGHPQFFSSLIGIEDTQDPINPPLESLPDTCWNKHKKVFTFSQLKKKEHAMYQPLVTTLNVIIRSGSGGVENAGSLTTPPQGKISMETPTYEFVETHQGFASRISLEHKAKAEPYHHRRPDLAMVIQSSRESSWYDVALSIEVKKQLGIETIQQAEAQAEALLQNAPTKRFLFSFIISGPELEVCLWDRAGVITSPVVDDNANPHLFLRIVRSFASMSLGDLGFDETSVHPPQRFKNPTDCAPIGFPIAQVGGDLYYRLQTVSWSSSCFGRSTRCFIARKLISKNGRKVCSTNPYLLKYFWNDVKRSPDEGEIYEKIQKAHVKSGVAKFESFVRSSRISEHRKGLPLIQARHTQESASGDDKDRLGSGEDEDTTEEAQVAGDRQLCVLVLGTVGRSLGKCKTVEELLAATISAIKAHGEIYAKAGILHRDISMSNVRIYDPIEFGDCEDEDDNRDREVETKAREDERGILIDFDLSLILEDSDKNHVERLVRTGTFSFMAWQILKPNRKPNRAVGNQDPALSSTHGFQHDLQSFFWLLLYICAGSPTFTGEPLDTEHPSSDILSLFSAQDEISASRLKAYFLTYPDLWLAPDFQVMMEPLNKLVVLLHPAKWNELTHNAFLDILKEAKEAKDPRLHRVIQTHRFKPRYRLDPYKVQREAKSNLSPAGAPANHSVGDEHPRTRSQSSNKAGSATGPTLHQPQPSDSKSKKRFADSSFLQKGAHKRTRPG